MWVELILEKKGFLNEGYYCGVGRLFKNYITRVYSGSAV